MLFHSATFLCFAAALVAAYWALQNQRARLLVLLVASLVFYAWRHWPSVFLLLGSIGINYALGRWLESRRSKAVLVFGIALNLSALGFFKYGRFAVEQAEQLAALWGVTVHWPKPSGWLPLGISFFTFQVVAYLVDVYRGTLKAERDVLVFGVFKAFFAQLVAGPIVRGHEFLPQLREFRRFDAAKLHHGGWLVLTGLFLKVGVADVLGDYVDWAWLNRENLGVNNAWLCVYAYAVQLLADFWGYSTMAVGLASCVGLRLPVNFEHPYAASSLREFWRRWHITLSGWLRDYLYIPLGGNRGHSATRAAFNRLMTMALGGLWHGAGWNFVLWGVLHGLWMDGEQATKRWVEQLPRWSRIALTFHVVVLLWVPFRAPSLGAAGVMLSRLVCTTWDISTPPVTTVLTLGFMLLQGRLFDLVREGAIERRRPLFEVALAIGMLWVLLAYGHARQDFIYFVF